MAYAVVIDKTELCLVALNKILIALSREVNPSFVLIYLRGSENAEEKLKEIKEKAAKDRIALEVKVIEYGGIERDAESICKIASQLNATGIFVPEHMHLLKEKIEECCVKMPECSLTVETISIHILPLVYELMTKNIAEVSPEATLQEAAKLMIERRIGSLVVVENKKLVGIITEHDFVKNAYKNGSTKKVTIKEIMSQPVVTISKYESVLDACKLFMKHRIKKLIVVDEKDLPHGVITTTDLVKLPVGLFDNINSLLSNFRVHH